MAVVKSSGLYRNLSRSKQLKEFCVFLVERKVFSNPKEAESTLKLWSISTHDTTQEGKRDEAEKLFKEWSFPKSQVNMDKYNKRLGNIFANQKREAVKTQINNIVDTVEEGLMDLTLGIKSMDKDKLLRAKQKIEEALYGNNS